MNVDRAVKGLQLAATHGLHDLVTGEHAPGPLGHGHQQIELVGGEVAGLSTDGDDAGIAVNVECAKAQAGLATRTGHRSAHGWRRPAALAMAAQHSADAGQQLAGLEGFGQVIVSPHFQTNDAVHRVALGGEHQQRHATQRTGQGTDAAAHLQAIHVGQHQVEDDQGWHSLGMGGGTGLFACATQGGQPLGGIGRMAHGIARLPQILRHHARQAHIVFNHQQGWGHGVESRNVQVKCASVRAEQQGHVSAM